MIPEAKTVVPRPLRRPFLLAAALVVVMGMVTALSAGPWSVPLVHVHIEAAGEEVDASFGDFGRRPVACPSEWQGAVAAGEMEMRVTVERAGEKEGLTAITDCDN